MTLKIFQNYFKTILVHNVTTASVLLKTNLTTDATSYNLIISHRALCRGYM